MDVNWDKKNPDILYNFWSVLSQNMDKTQCSLHSNHRQFSQIANSKQLVHILKHDIL